MSLHAKPIAGRSICQNARINIILLSFSVRCGCFAPEVRFYYQRLPSWWWRNVGRPLSCAGRHSIRI